MSGLSWVPYSATLAVLMPGKQRFPHASANNPGLTVMIRGKMLHVGVERLGRIRKTNHNSNIDKNRQNNTHKDANFIVHPVGVLINEQSTGTKIVTGLMVTATTDEGEDDEMRWQRISLRREWT